MESHGHEVSVWGDKVLERIKHEQQKTVHLAFYISYHTKKKLSFNGHLSYGISFAILRLLLRNMYSLPTSSIDACLLFTV